MSSTWLVNEQIKRLKSRFGERAFDDEFVKLVTAEMLGMPDYALTSFINGCIGERPANRPPLLTDFRQARINAAKASFDQDTFGAQRAMHTPWQNGLQAYLAKEFPGCKTLAEAVEVRKLQIQIERAKNPKYDPMLDPKWQ